MGYDWQRELGRCREFFPIAAYRLLSNKKVSMDDILSGGRFPWSISGMVRGFSRIDVGGIGILVSRPVATGEAVKESSLD